MLSKNSGIQVKFPVDKYLKNTVNSVNLKGGCLSYCKEVNKLMGFEILMPKRSTEWTETPVE